ncbi:MAG: PH domain-containing protein [Thermoanaerobaculia bacterium]
MIHRAPWGKHLIGVTVAASAICVGVSYLMWRNISETGLLRSAVIALPLVIPVGGLLFCIRGFRLDGAHLYVRRLFWETGVDLRELESVAVDPAAMKGSLRTFGNGGLFSFSGRYRNKKLGSYRAFVTDFGRTVILRFSQSAVVLSPGDPEAFVADLLMHNPGARRAEGQPS